MGNGVPNFPTPPARSFNALSMPNDLVANKRNYYTEIYFLDYRSAAYEGFGGNIVNALSNLNQTAGNILGAINGAIASGLGQVRTSSIRLPIPNKVNDITTLSWQPISITRAASGAAGAALSGFLSPAVSQSLQQGGSIVLGLAGKTLNPLLFLAFNNQDFKEYTFEWVLAPRNEQESRTTLEIVEFFKGAALPTWGVPFQDYPLIAKVVMSPNNLGGHAIFKPMAIKAVSANYTSNPTPSFFGNSGSPTIVTLTIRFQEIKLWYRNPLNNKPY